MAVYSLDVYVGSLYRTIETTTKHTTARSTTCTIDMCSSVYLSRESSTHDIHHRIVAEEVFMFFTFYDVIAFIYASTSLHSHFYMRIVEHKGLLSKSTTKYTEVRRTHLIKYLLPLI